MHKNATLLGLPNFLIILGVSLCLIGAQTARSDGPFTYESLVRLVDSRDLRSIEDLLPLLPVDLLSNYTLMKNSRSLQRATSAAPRVILYGRDASLIIAYAGESADGSMDNPAQQLEVIQYRAEERSFEMRFVSFSKGREKPFFSEKNPQVCLGCHRMDPRPNWESYFQWPGALAANDDELRVDEIPIVQAFDRLQRTNSRYRPLKGLSEGYMKAEGGRTRLLHNGLFSARAAHLNFNRLTRIMESTPDYSRYRYAILASPFCKNIADFLPDRIKAHHSLPSPPASLELNRWEVGPYYIFEQRGVSMDGWYMGFMPGTFDYRTFGNQADEFAYALLKDNSDLLPYFKIYSSDVEDYSFMRAELIDCESLRKLSLEAFDRGDVRSISLTPSAPTERQSGYSFELTQVSGTIATKEVPRSPSYFSKWSRNPKPKEAHSRDR